MSILLVSPAEPPKLRALGKVDSLPERRGVDFLLLPHNIGWQRKEVHDFVASVNGDRLAREVQQMSALTGAGVIIEGPGWWTVEGMWVNPHAPTKFSRAQFFGIVLSLQARGIKVVQTADMRDTAHFIREMAAWSNKDNHRALATRPNLRTPWGSATNEDFAAWMLQSFPSIGPSTATAMVKAFGGPGLRWAVTYEELCAVPGVGPGRAAKLWTSLGEMVPERKRRRRKSTSTDSGSQLKVAP